MTNMEEKTMVLALKMKACSRDKYKRYYKATTTLRELTYIRVKENNKLKETLQAVWQERLIYRD